MAIDWVKLRPSAWWKATRNIHPEKRGEYMDEAMECVEENRRGVNAFADALMMEADAHLEAKRNAGKAGCDAKARNRAIREGLAMPSSAKQKLAQASKPKHTLADSTHNNNITVPFGDLPIPLPSPSPIPSPCRGVSRATAREERAEDAPSKAPSTGRSTGRSTAPTQVDTPTGFDNGENPR